MGFLDPNAWANALSSDPTGSKFAAQLQQQSAGNALAMQQEQFDYARQKMDPFVQGGQQRYLDLMKATSPGGRYDTQAGFTMDQYLQSPEYALNQAALDKQNQGIAAQSAAAGSFGNPAVQNALAQAMQANLGQNYQQARGNWLSDYNRLAGLGNPNAAQQTIDYGANYANQAGNLGMQAANAMGQGQMGAQAGRSAATAGLSNSLGQFGGQLANYFANQPSSTGYDPYAGAAVDTGYASAASGTAGLANDPSAYV